MTESNLLYTAISVFALMLIGIVLTVVEFRYGAPHRQDEEARKKAKESDTGQH